MGRDASNRIERHDAEIASRRQQPAPGFSAEAAVAVVQRGGRFNLAGHNRSDRELEAWALTRVAGVRLSSPKGDGCFTFSTTSIAPAYLSSPVRSWN